MTFEEWWYRHHMQGGTKLTNAFVERSKASARMGWEAALEHSGDVEDGGITEALVAMARSAAIDECAHECEAHISLKLAERIDELVKQHGGIRAAARVVKIDHAYLFRLYDGTKKEPSATVLKKLGLRRVVDYVRASSTRTRT